MTPTPAIRANLNIAIEHTEPHLLSVLKAVCDMGLALMFVPRAAEPFRIPAAATKPTLTIIGDDFDAALGPGAFHRRSLPRVIRGSSSFAVVSSAPPVEVYGTASALAAVARVNIVLIETQPEQELAWVALIQKLASGRLMWLHTIKGGHA